MKLEEGYTNSTITVLGKNNNIIGTGKKFSIDVKNLEDNDTNIYYIKGIELNKYKVTFNITDLEGVNNITRGDDEIPLEENIFVDTVEHGKNYTYTLNLNEGYNKNNLSATLAGDDKPLLNENNEIGISEVKSDLTITVTGIELNKYKVTFNITGFEKIKNITRGNDEIPLEGNFFVDNKAEHGKSYEYTVVPADGYRLDECNVDGDGEKDLQSTEDKLIIKLKNVTRDSEINISGILNKQCNIKFLLDPKNPGTDGTVKIEDALYIKEAGTKRDLLEGKTSISIDIIKDFEFTIEVREGFDGRKKNVKANSYTLSESEEENSGKKFTITKEQLSEIYNNKSNGKECTVTISEIYKLYDVEFKVDDAYKNKVKISYLDYDENYSNSKKDTTSDKSNDASSGKLIRNLIPYKKDFQFKVEVIDNEYRLSDNFIKNKSNFKNMSITMEPDFSKEKFVKECTVTIKGIKGDLTKDNGSYIEIEPSEYTYTLKFNLSEEIKDKVTLYESDASGKEITTIFSENENGSINYHKVVIGESTHILAKVSENCKVDLNELKLTVADTKGEFKGKKLSDSSYLFEVSTGRSNSTDKRILNIKVEGISLKKLSINFRHLNRVQIKWYKDGFNNEKSEVVDDIETGNIKALNYGENLCLEIIGKNGNNVNLSDALSLTDEKGNPLKYDSWTSDEGHQRLIVYKVTSNVEISLDLEQKYSLLRFNKCDGLSFYLVDDNKEFGRKIIGSETVKKDKNAEFNFGVKADAGYDLNSAGITIKVPSGAEPTAVKLDSIKENDYHIYKISGIESTDSIEINSTIKVLSFNVKFVSDYQLSNAGEGENKDTKVEFYNVSKIKIGSEGLTASYGETAEFSIKLEDRCSNSDIKVKVYKENSDKYEELNLVNGKYQILNVYENLEVSVEGLSLNKYVLNFVDNIAAYFLDTESGNSFSGTKIIDYGKDYEFKLVAKTGYVLGDYIAVNIVSSNGIAKELKPTSSGIYKITNITEGYTITIENVENITYSINFTDTAGVIYYNDQGAAISGNFKVKYGQNFEFSVGIEDAYDESISNIYILVNDGKGSNVTAQKLASGRYLIQNITEDITIKVGNVVKNKYVVTLTDTEGIDYYSASGSVIKGDNQVEYGGDFYFKVKLYPAYADSKIKVMLGDQELSLEDNMYKVPRVIENKTVTVLGVEKTNAISLISKIETLPSSVNDANDMEAVIEATRLYNSLNESQKSSISNYGSLKSLQESMAPLNHIYNGVEIEGLEWYVKIVANPILADIEACARIYEKLNSEYILSLYDVYLWDVVNDKRYTLPEGQTVVVKFPTPDMTYFESPTGIHENSNGKVDFLTLNMSNNVTSLETSSFSPMGIVAKRSNLPGRSSLIDSLDANLSVLTDYTLNSLSGNSKNSNNNSDKVTLNNSNQSGNQELDSENGQEKSDSQNIGNTRLGSALKLVLILVILGIIATGIYVFMKNRKNKDDSN